MHTKIQNFRLTRLYVNTRIRGLSKIELKCEILVVIIATYYFFFTFLISLTLNQN